MASEDILVIALIGMPIGAYFLVPEFKQWVNETLNINGGGGTTTNQLKILSVVAAVAINCMKTGKSGTQAQVTAFANRIYANSRSELNKIAANTSGNQTVLLNALKQIATKNGINCSTCTFSKASTCVNQIGLSVRQVAAGIY